MKLKIPKLDVGWFSRGGAAATKRSKAWVKYAVLGASFYVIFLLISVPANWLAWGISKYSLGATAITQPNGTIWNGSGHLVMAYPRSRAHDFGKIQWTVNPLWWLTGRARVKLNALDKNISGKLTIQRTFGNTSLIDSKTSLPATVIEKFYAPAGLLSPSGQVIIKTDSFSYDDTGVTGELDAEWNNAGSALSPVNPLGDYHLNIKGKGKTAAITLKTKKGDLQMVGKGTWNVIGSGLVNFGGTANPANKKAELEPLLKLFGRDMGNGRRLLKLRTTIKLPGSRKAAPNK